MTAKKQRLEPRFCTKCGTQLTDGFRKVHHNPESGEQLYNVKSYCPNRQYFWDRHDTYWRAADYTTGQVRRIYTADGVEI